MRKYLDQMQDVLDNGKDRTDRTGVGTRGVFGRQLRYDLSEGLPLVTTKTCHLRSIIHELLWFLMGETNIKYLNDNGVKIWNEWADENGELKEIYGEQWIKWDDTRVIPAEQFNAQEEDYFNRGFELIHIYDGKAVIQRKINQIQNVVDQIKNTPDSRRIILSGWNCAKIEEMALPPCHTMYQWYVSEGKLSCQLYNRSADYFLGTPFNTISAVLLTAMLAHQCNLELGDFIHTFGDLHLYQNHITDDIVHEQLRREPRALPTLRFKRKPDSIFDYKSDDFIIEGYDPHPPIKAPVAV